MSWKDIIKYDDDELEYVYDGVYMRPSQRRGRFDDEDLDIEVTVRLQKEEGEEPLYDVYARKDAGPDGSLDWNAEWEIEKNYINPEQIQNDLEEYLLDKYSQEDLTPNDINYTYYSQYYNEDIKEGGMPLEDGDEHSSLAEAINYLKSKPQPN